MRIDPTVSHAVPPIDDDLLKPIQDALVGWYGRNARDLPWRRTRDPYAILVSEVMLQQIQVVRAIPFYLAFLERFPTIQALAAASVADVIHVWGNLGRYRRITNLHATARRIVTEFGGEVPANVDLLRTLPGIGPYTAGAVACFAFGQDVGFLDTNARRVLHRIFVGGDVPTTVVPERAIQEIAGRVVPAGRGWVWNQAVIELGALVCTARSPRCEACPMRNHCVAAPTIADAVVAARKIPRERARPAYDATNAVHRGRVLAALRASTAGVELRTLGSDLRPAFTTEDIPWIAGVVESLRKDGLASVSEDRPTYSADPSSGPDTDGSIWVRLPD